MKVVIQMTLEAAKVAAKKWPNDRSIPEQALVDEHYNIDEIKNLDFEANRLQTIGYRG